MQYVVPENIHTSSKEGILFKTPPRTTPLEIPIKLYTFFLILWSYKVWIFSGMAQWWQKVNWIDWSCILIYM